MNMYLFVKYWGKHKGRLFSLILSIILLTATAVFSVLNERTELRRQLHGMYDAYGNYTAAVRNVTSEQDERIREMPFEEIGVVSAIGTVETSDTKYTIGCYEDGNAEDLNHLAMLEGNLPTNKGEIAMPEFLLNRLYGSAQIGDEITFEFEDLDHNKTEVTYKLSGIIKGHTYRNDMEYTGRSDGITITAVDIEYPSPSVYIYRDDTEGFAKYYNYLLSVSDELYFSEEGNAEVNALFGKLWEISDNVTSGSQFFILQTLAGKLVPGQTRVEAATSDNIKVIHIITLLMVITATISMFSGVISIMPQRIESLRLLRSIGMSKRKLLSIFMTEFFVFWIMGNALGVAFGCGVHELLIALQKLLGIPAYRGYVTEYLIGQRTSSPFIMTIALSLVIAVISLIIPLKSIITMKFYKTPTAKKSRRKVGNLRSAFSKMTGNRPQSALICISMAIVIFSTAFGYCYYTQFGKGSTLFSIGKKDVADEYYKVGSVDIKEKDIDCAVTAAIPEVKYASSLAVYDSGYGISADELQPLGDSAELLSWGRYPPGVVAYDINEKAPGLLGNSLVPLNEEGMFYDDLKGNNYYWVSLVLLNENMMKLCGADKDDVVMVSGNYNFPYEVGDTVPMFTCLSDDKGYLRPDTMKHFSTTVTKQISLKDVDEDSMLNYAFTGGFSIAMTAEKAESLGFYYPNYNTVMMRFHGKLSDKEMRKYVSSAVKDVQIVTIHQLKRNARMNILSSNANSVILFLLLFILCFISVYNLLQMNIKNNTEKFSVMHSVGLPLDKIKKMFVRSMMTTGVIAALCGILISLAGQGFLKAKYDEYYALLAKQNEMCGVTDFPDSMIVWELWALEKDDPIYDITEKMENLRDTFMLESEMWLPNLVIPLCVICAVILLSMWICSHSAVKKIKDERVREDD